MKKIILGLLILSTMFITACEDDETTNETPVANSTSNNNTGTDSFVIETTPSAQAANDNKAAGVYKGTFVGSTGSFKLIIRSNEISGLLILDGKSHSLFSDNLTSADLNSEIIDAIFKNSDETVSLSFSADADGKDPRAEITADGHPDIKVTIEKETSSNQVKVYEGYVYYSYGESSNAYQCALNTNVVIKGKSGKTAAVYKYSHDQSFQGKADCDKEDKGIIDGYLYTVTGTQLEMYTWVAECDTCNPFKEGFMGIAERGIITDDEIIFTGGTWTTAGGRTLQDSLHLFRKL